MPMCLRWSYVLIELSPIGSPVLLVRGVRHCILRPGSAVGLVPPTARSVHDAQCIMHSAPRCALCTVRGVVCFITAALMVVVSGRCSALESY